MQGWYPMRLRARFNLYALNIRSQRYTDRYRPACGMCLLRIIVVVVCVRMLCIHYYEQSMPKGLTNNPTNWFCLTCPAHLFIYYTFAPSISLVPSSLHSVLLFVFFAFTLFCPKQFHPAQRLISTSFRRIGPNPDA